MNYKRFEKNLNLFAKIGYKQGNGITRLGFSEEYFKSIELLEKYAKEKGFLTNKDKVGNLFITYNPNNSDEFIMIGSHMDTVKSGGLYDGALGVMAALEVLETLKDEKENLNYGIIAAAFNSEESSNIGGTFGSRTACNRNDLDSKDLEEKIKEVGLTIDDLRESVFDFSKVIGFLELHIEQGGILEHKKLEIGVVDGIVGITRYNVILKGESNHAGTTPMSLRKDPVRKVSTVLDELYKEASKFDQPFVMTVGDIKVRPGMYNIIPNEVEIFIEVRDINQNNIDEFFGNIRTFLQNNVDNYDFVKNVEKPSVHLDTNIINNIEDACKELGFNYQIMSSGAGHDAKEISHIVPTGLIFIPSKDGISHSPKEYSSPEEIEKGLDLLYKVSSKLIGG